jgi:serine/threonine protein phosphatase PrpC
VIRHFVHTEPGEGHQNEDAAQVQRHPQDGGTLICALADGQGGRSGGSSAARRAVAECMTAIMDKPPRELLNASSWYVIVTSADDSVAEADDAGLTTLVALCIDGRKIQGASCGDSAALLLQDGTVRWLTEKQRKNPPVGSSEAFPVAFAADLHASWKLLIMSDGVWRYVGDKAVAHIAAEHNGAELIAALRQVALDGNGGRLGDDFSVILVQSD